MFNLKHIIGIYLLLLRALRLSLLLLLPLRRSLLLLLSRPMLPAFTAWRLKDPLILPSDLYVQHQKCVHRWETAISHFLQPNRTEQVPGFCQQVSEHPSQRFQVPNDL